VPTPRPRRSSSEHDLWFPQPDDALTRAPTWLRRIGKTADGQAVTLGMVLEEEPASRHEDRIAEHRQALEAMISLSEVVLNSAAVGDGARGACGLQPVVLRRGSSPRSWPSVRRVPAASTSRCGGPAWSPWRRQRCMPGAAWWVGKGSGPMTGAAKAVGPLRRSRVGDGPGLALEMLRSAPRAGSGRACGPWRGSSRWRRTPRLPRGFGSPPRSWRGS
jgi:hypothetical protein